MRILIHTVNYAPAPISTGKYTGEMGEWLAAQGHDVRVVAAPPYYPDWCVQKGYSTRRYQYETVAGTKVFRCPIWIPDRATGLKRVLHQGSFAASSVPVMLRQALWKPDVVLVVEPSLACAPAALLAARLCGAKTWLHIQDFELDAALNLGLLGGRGVRRSLYAIEKSLMRRFSRVSTITEAMRGRVVRKGVSESRACLIPNWANMESVSPMPRENAVRRRLGVSLDRVLVMYAGNMGEKQGLNLVVEAAYILRGREDIRFVMVGTGAAREKLETMAEQRGLDNVRFFPVQPLEQLPLLLAAGDIHLVVQRKEAADLVMPSKLTNILAAGRPAIATAKPGTTLHDVLNQHNCGLTTAPEEAEDLAESIITLADSPEDRERLGENARRYAESCLDKDAILTRLENGLRKLAKGVE